MSTFDSDDLGKVGHSLPEDSRLRLKKLREYAEFLSHLTQPRTADEERECIRMGEVAICLELLVEQMGLVLDEIPRPPGRSEGEAAPGADAESKVEEEAPGAAGVRYVFGMTLEQIDTLHRLISMITAHGDVVIASDDAEVASHTLSLLGHAISDDAMAVCQIIRQVESQRLGPARGAQAGVSEERAVYHVVRAPSPAGGAAHPARRMATCPPALSLVPAVNTAPPSTVHRPTATPPPVVPWFHARRRLARVSAGPAPGRTATSR